MNEYQEEFVKIFDFAKAQLNNYSQYLATKGIKNPFTEENKNSYLEQLLNCYSDEEYIKKIDQFLTSVHQGHLFLKTLNSSQHSQKYPLLFRYDNGKYKVSLAGNRSLEGEEVELINGISPDEYILNLPGFSYDNENQKPYQLEFRIPVEQTAPLQLKLVNMTETIYYSQNKDYSQEEQEIQKRVFSQITDNLTLHEGQIKWQDIDGIMYLSIDSFNRNKLDIDKIVLDQLLNYIDTNHIEDVIIDIRGNVGGSDEYFELLGKLGNKEYNYTAEFNYISGSIYADEINSGKIFSIDEIFKRKTEAVAKAGQIDFKIVGNNSTVKSITLLVDAFTYSNADSFTKFAKKTGFAKVVGSPTSGDGVGLTPLTVTTPILSRNSASINIPSTEIRNYDDFITIPEKVIGDTPVCHYLYGTKEDTLLYQVIDNIKKEE